MYISIRVVYYTTKYKGSTSLGKPFHTWLYTYKDNHILM